MLMMTMINYILVTKPIGRLVDLMIIFSPVVITRLTYCKSFLAFGAFDGCCMR